MPLYRTKNLFFMGKGRCKEYRVIGKEIVFGWQDRENKQLADCFIQYIRTTSLKISQKVQISSSTVRNERVHQSIDKIDCCVATFCVPSCGTGAATFLTDFLKFWARAWVACLYVITEKWHACHWQAAHEGRGRTSLQELYCIYDLYGSIRLAHLLEYCQDTVCTVQYTFPD
jgi:hypothetical protein